MLAAVAMCILFRSYLRGARFTLRTDHKSLVWLHRFKDTEGMMSRWLHSLQHGDADGLSRAPSSPCRQCTGPDCPPAVLIHDDTDQPFDSVSTGSSEDADLVPVQSGEDWIARLDDDLSQPAAISGDSFRISALQREDPVCITLHSWIVADEFHPWAEVKSMLPESSQQFVIRRQWYLVAQEKFTEPPLTAIGPQGRPGTALLVVPRFIVWWSPGKDADPSEAVSPLPLVGYV